MGTLEVIERLKQERMDLLEKLSKLETALAKDGFKAMVGEYQYMLLNIQYNAMKSYLGVLDLRIEDLEN